MDFKQHNASLGGLSNTVADALLVVVGDKSVSSSFDSALTALINDAVEQGDFELKSGATLYVHRPVGIKATRVVFAVAGDDTPKAFGKALMAGLNVVKKTGAKHIAVVSTADVGELHGEALVSAAHNATYLYRHTKPSAPKPSGLAKVTFLTEPSHGRAASLGLVRGQAIATGVLLARECANRPPNHATPTFLADQAKKLAKANHFKVEVLDRKDVEKLGMGSFIAVAQGSNEPLRFIVMRYDGGTKRDAPIVLVGKGITFDTGGISIKPSAAMDEMKFDMGGAASVLGTFAAVAQLNLAVNLIGLIPACENMPGGGAVKPGDVVTSLSGQTIEILNTDAEGRLILCDALTYAERFEPSVVVDIATLTGACVVALGHHNSGLFTPDEDLADELLAASRDAQDPVWRMPLDDEYNENLKSNFADMANVGPREGGAITAAMFLKRFTKNYRWAHLDIAGTAWKSGASKGATGRPVPLLTHFVIARAMAAATRGKAPADSLKAKTNEMPRKLSRRAAGID